MYISSCITALLLYSITRTSVVNAVDVQPSFIHDIQGNGSAIVTPYIVNVTAIVTSLYRNGITVTGFWIQEEDIDADTDLNTSEGIFVKCAGCSTIVIGDQVNVVGNAGQRFTTTQIDSTVANGYVIIRSSGNILPTAITLTLPASTSTALLSTYQHLEGMIVYFSTTLFINDLFYLGRYGTIELTESSVPFVFTQNNRPDITGFLIATRSRDLRRILLDDDNDNQNRNPTYYPTGGFSLNNKFRIGDTISGVRGVLQYDLDTWRIRPIYQADFTYTKNNFETTNPENVDGNLRITTFNLGQYFTTLNSRGANTQLELIRQTDKIVAAIDKLNPDIAGLVGLENSPSNTAISFLVDALNAVKGSGTYTYIPTGLIGTDLSSLGLIYKSSVAQPINSFALLTNAVNPIFDDTLNRPVLIQTFEHISTGERLTISVCSLISKGGSCINDPDISDGQGNCPKTRTDATTALFHFLASDPTSSGDPDHLVLGQLSAYASDDAIVALENAGYSNLIKTKAGNQSYNFLIFGERSTVHYAMASPSLLPQINNATHWYINSDESRLFDYNVEFKYTSLPLYANDPFASAFVDPILLGLTLQSNAPVPVPVPVPASLPAPILIPLTVPVPLPVPFEIPVATVPIPVPTAFLSPVSLPTVPSPAEIQAPVPVPAPLPVHAPVPQTEIIPLPVPVSGPLQVTLSPSIPTVLVPVPRPVPLPVPVTSPFVMPVPSSPISVPIPVPLSVLNPAPLPVKGPSPVAVAPIPITGPAGPTPITRPVPMPVSGFIPTPVVLPPPVQVSIPSLPVPEPFMAQVPIPVPTPSVIIPPVQQPVQPISVPITKPTLSIPVNVPTIPVPVPVSSTGVPSIVAVPVTPEPITNCGLFGFNIFCPRRNECGFIKRLFHIGNC